MSFNRPVFAFCTSALAIFGLASCGQDWVTFSRVASPDGLLIAENMGDIYDPYVGGRVVVRQYDGGDIYEALFSETQPSMFMRWTDNNRLTILSDSRNTRLTGPKALGSIEVNYSTYQRFGASDAALNAKVRESAMLNPPDVSAAFDSKHTKTPGRKLCDLKLTGKDGIRFSTIGLSIEASVGPCAPPSLSDKICGGIDTHFDIGQPIDRTTHLLLTSATVSEIPSYNELPDGDDYRAVRGQFIEKSALRLIEALKGPSFGIDYNFDFDQRSIKYMVRTEAISEALSEFDLCVGSADFDWMSHK